MFERFFLDQNFQNGGWQANPESKSVAPGSQLEGTRAPLPGILFLFFLFRPRMSLISLGRGFLTVAWGERKRGECVGPSCDLHTVGQNQFYIAILSHNLHVCMVSGECSIHSFVGFRGGLNQ